MWETFISWYINNYLGHYVENLNSQQLSLALSKGELELENVPLKKNIFRSWGLPVDVKSGVVGRIKIEFNILKYFRNEPVLISIEDVCLVAGPVNLAELDPLEEEALAHESKMSALDAHESRWKAQFDLQQQTNNSSYYSSLYVSSMRIGASIVTKVVENLQLNVTNVHIRFEYENEKSNHPVAFGVTLQGLNVQSCDPKWNPLSSSSTNISDSSFKTLKMSNLGVYCDTKAESLSDFKLEELKIAMCKPLPSHIYVLSPVSAEARVAKNNSTLPLASLSKPRFDVHLSLEKVPLQLSDSQYTCTFRLYKSLRKLDRNCRLRHYRPFNNVKENIKEWWLYASQAVLSLRGFRRRKKLKTWDEMLHRARDNRDYVHAYQGHLTEEVLSSEATKLKDRMELDLHYDDIVQLRQVAMQRIEQMNKASEVSSKSQPVVEPTMMTTTTTSALSSINDPGQGIQEINAVTPTEEPQEGAKAASSGILTWFFPSWGYYTQATEQPDSLTNVNSQLLHGVSSSSLADRSMSETDFDEAILGEMRAFGQDALLARFNFTLNEGSVLLNKNKGPFLDLNFGGVSLELSLKPRSGSHKLQMRLSSLILKDAATNSCILAPHSADPLSYLANASADPLFNLVYEMKPHKKAGHRVTVSTKPMDLVLYPSTWDEVGRFFSVKDDEDYLEIPYNGYEAMKQKTKEELQVYWDRLVHSRISNSSGDDGRSSWEIYMDIFAPQITIYGYATKEDGNKKTETVSLTIPQDQSTIQESAVIIDLGRFKFTNLHIDDKILLPPDDNKEYEDWSDDDENEEFLTPCSSPVPGRLEMEDSSLLTSPRHSVSETGESIAYQNQTDGIESFGGSLDKIHAIFYKKYSLEITDVQVIVFDGKSGKKTSWKTTHFKGTSMMHLVDRFSINLQLERRLVYSEDPLWPALTLMGTLPKLTFHLNEVKMLTLRSVLSAFSTKLQNPRQESSDISFFSGSQLNLADAERPDFRLSETMMTRNPHKSFGNLFVAEFAIHNVSVDLQSEDIRGPVIKVKALHLKLAKTRKHRAKDDANRELKSRCQEYFNVEGRLGSLEIQDTSLYYGLYPVKFAFQGDQALDFDYELNGSDGKFRLNMSSIVVVHTNRFYTEFMSLWNSLFGHSPSGAQQGHPSNDNDRLSPPVEPGNNNTRVMLDIQAGAPVILLPYSSTSEKMLVADLGHLSVRNKFVEDIDGLVINYIIVDLIEMDLYSGELSPRVGAALDKRKQWNLHRGWSVIKTQDSSSFLRQQCQLNLKVGRVFEGNLDDSVASTRVEGVLSTLHCTIDPEKYKLIRGLLAHNIGENIGSTEEEPTVNYQQGTSGSKLHHMGTHRQGESPTKVDLNIQLDLINVTLEVVKHPGDKLGRVEFIKSKFTFQSNNDGSKDVDLASQEILICDSRFEDIDNTREAETVNIFTNILQQSVTVPISLSSKQQPESSSAHNNTIHVGSAEVPLQAEVHYRMTQRGSNVTIILNNMRLMVILDWWMEVRDFLGQEIPQPPEITAIWEEHLERTKNAHHLLERSRVVSNPVTVSTGIVTRRAPVLDLPDSVFELKINISNCELVAVEKASVWDTNALILKASAALGYRPHLERPICCNILQCELFSCILGLESETALSILDPTNIQLDIVRQTESESKGILDATLSLANSGKILKIQSPNLNLRLSYYDMKMFLRLMDKFSKDAQVHFLKSSSFEIETSPLASPTNIMDDLSFQSFATFEIDQLVLMGFTIDEAIQALEETHGCLEDAVFFLTSTAGRPDKKIKSQSDKKTSRDNSLSAKSLASSEAPSLSHEKETGGGSMSAIQGIEVKCNCLSLCVIDDCKDSDVPVLEISVQQLELYQNYLDNLTTADCVLSGDYYNRALSGWEPFLEPWKCNVKWKKNLLGQLDDYSPSCEFPSRAPEFEIMVSSRVTMELNVTSSLLNLYKIVSSNWTEDYHLLKNDKRRAPFIPFALKNETGSRLWFCTSISNNEEVFRQQQKSSTGGSSCATSWTEVAHGAVQTFSFEGRGKLRHRNTHQLKTHQLSIRVDGWNEISVSVDRVGTYFRVAKPETSLRRYGGYMELPPTRLVLEVGLQGSAQKIVTIRSALMIKNSLPNPVELKLENTIVYPSFERAQTGGSMVVQVRPGATYPVPLHSVWAHMWIRPVIPDNPPRTYLYCTKALLVGSSQEGLRECLREHRPMSPEDQSQSYRFCAAVKRNEFPADSDDIIPQNSLPSIVQLMSMSNRANFITLLSPFKLVNLLPHEISYEIKRQNIYGRIPPGKHDSMSNVDTSEPIEIHYQVDNFAQGMIVSVNPKSNTLTQRIKIQDAMKRTLMLTIKILKEDGGVLSVQLSCPSWIVNKSGLPLVCKQDGISGEAAGQFQEHEVGRMVTPLMMSFADQDGSESLIFRVGTGLHKDSKPFWCRSILCQNGLRVRKLVVAHCNNTPQSVYMVGVEIKNGTGRYQDTKLVIVSPRFVVDNRSTYKIQISQRAFATSFFDAKAEKTHLTLPAGSNLPFHWPRLDKEQLLCVRLKDVAGSSWSGGFPVDNVDSFHINIRDADGNCYFLRVEIVIQGPSYFLIFSDTTQLPPPFRIDNFSKVPLIFHQTCLGEERLKITARPESSLPYALDEPTQLAHLTIAAPGGTSVVVNMDDLRYMSHLTYENFFYIGFTATFPVDGSIGRSGMESLELVLDVQGVNVILTKKEQGKRSQLWRVSAEGLIEHEGSSPPRDLTKPQKEGTMLVLDISGSAPLPTQCVPLQLRKPDRRRISTQHWEFTSDGKMKCKMYENLYVQAKDGFGGTNAVGSWQLWSDVVLGPSQPVCYIRTESGIPAEQAIARQKLRAGSGILSLGLETDGPTRVLRIIDVEHPPRRQLLHHTFEENDYNTTPKYRVKVELPAGVGISVVACNPREELLYGRFSGFALEWTDTKNSQILKASVLNLQVDNQLLESEKSAVIYIPSGSPSETIDDFSLYHQQPALCLYWESMKSNLNARVFKVWELIVKPISLIIEERLLLKMCMWWGFGQQVKNLDMLQQSDFEVQKALTSTASTNTRRYYFAILKLIFNQVKLSVLTTSKLPVQLAALKRRLGLTLIRFEDAIVDFDSFEKHHPFETFEFLCALVVKHYRDELVSQAGIILGSTDILGNPLGFVNDVSEGVSLMIYEGSVGALVKNVAHGLSNSAAKVTGTLGEGLGKTILDDRHEEERRRIKEDHAGSSGEYLYAGLKGFGHGLIGGVTSVVSQSYEGVANEGFAGLFTGLTKGLVGTITKPAVGVLDLATGAASAIRDSSKTSSRMIPHRLRPTRVAIGNGGLLPVYSEVSSRGQELLFDLNDKNFNELYIACETLKSGPNQDLRIMISSEAITVFRPNKGNPVLLKVHLSELIECQMAHSAKEKTPYIELVRILPDVQAPGRPQVICENEQVAKRVVQQVNYAKALYEETRHSQIVVNENDE